MYYYGIIIPVVLILLAACNGKEDSAVGQASLIQAGDVYSCYVSDSLRGQKVCIETHSKINSEEDISKDCAELAEGMGYGIEFVAEECEASSIESRCFIEQGHADIYTSYYDGYNEESAKSDCLRFEELNPQWLAPGAVPHRGLFAGEDADPSITGSDVLLKLSPSRD